MAAQSPPAKKNLHEPGGDFKISARKTLTATPTEIAIPTLSLVVMPWCSVDTAVDDGTIMSSHDDVDVVSVKEEEIWACGDCCCSSESSPTPKLVACNRSPKPELIRLNEGFLLTLVAMVMG